MSATDRVEGSVDDQELRLRHLDTIQQVVSRLAQNSFTIRGWSVTLVTVVFAILSAQNDTASGLILVALAPTWIFWVLDAYYVRQERMYRRLYVAAARRLREGDAAPDIPLFEMNPRPYLDEREPLRRALLAPQVAAMPVTLTAIIVGIWLTRL